VVSQCTLVHSPASRFVLLLSTQKAILDRGVSVVVGAVPAFPIGVVEGTLGTTILVGETIGGDCGNTCLPIVGVASTRPGNAKLNSHAEMNAMMIIPPIIIEIFVFIASSFRSLVRADNLVQQHEKVAYQPAAKTATNVA